MTTIPPFTGIAVALVVAIALVVCVVWTILYCRCCCCHWTPRLPPPPATAKVHPIFTI